MSILSRLFPGHSELVETLQRSNEDLTLRLQQALLRAEAAESSLAADRTRHEKTWGELQRETSDATSLRRVISPTHTLSRIATSAVWDCTVYVGLALLEASGGLQGPSEAWLSWPSNKFQRLGWGHDAWPYINIWRDSRPDGSKPDVWDALTGALALLHGSILEISTATVQGYVDSKKGLYVVQTYRTRKPEIGDKGHLFIYDASRRVKVHSSRDLGFRIQESEELLESWDRSVRLFEVSDG